MVSVSARLIFCLALVAGETARARRRAAGGARVARGERGASVTGTVTVAAGVARGLPVLPVLLDHEIHLKQ